MIQTHYNLQCEHICSLLLTQKHWKCDQQIRSKYRLIRVVWDRIGHLERSDRYNLQNLKIHFEKSQDRHIPETVSPITAKLGKMMHTVILTVLTVKILNFINPRWWRSPFWQKKMKNASLTDLHHPTPSILPNKTANIIKQNWNQFLLVVKATALKQQISNFYPQILSTEASFYIYDRPVTGINVIAIASVRWICG